MDKATGKSSESPVLICIHCAPPVLLLCSLPQAEPWVKSKSLKIKCGRNPSRLLPLPSWLSPRSSDWIHLPQAELAAQALSRSVKWSLYIMCSDSDSKPSSMWSNTPHVRTWELLWSLTVRSCMREHDTGKSLGLTCRKAFSNMQISTQLQYSGGGEFSHVFISDTHRWKLVFYWAFVFQNKLTTQIWILEGFQIHK